MGLIFSRRVPEDLLNFLPNELEIVKQFEGEKIYEIDSMKEYRLTKDIKSRGFGLVHKLTILGCTYEYNFDAARRLLNVVSSELISLQTDNGWTPLMILVMNPELGYLTYKMEMIEIILSANPDLNARNDVGDTILMLAIKHSTEDVIELLLGSDQDLNLQNKMGNTALMLAVNHSTVRIVDMILKKGGVNLDLQDISGNTALMKCIRHVKGDTREKMVGLILKYPQNIDLQNIDGNTSLLLAARYATEDEVELILDNDPDVNIKNNEDLTALMVTVKHSNDESMKLILDATPDFTEYGKGDISELLSTVINMKSQDNDVCGICLDGKKNVCIDPCHHMATCEECIKICRTCPLCNVPIQRSYVVYY